jgi:hypothetical protein
LTKQERMERLCVSWLPHVRAEHGAFVRLVELPATSSKVAEVCWLHGVAAMVLAVWLLPSLGIPNPELAALVWAGHLYFDNVFCTNYKPT